MSYPGTGNFEFLQAVAMAVVQDAIARNVCLPPLTSRLEATGKHTREDH